MCLNQSSGLESAISNIYFRSIAIANVMNRLIVIEIYFILKQIYCVIYSLTEISG